MSISYEYAERIGLVRNSEPEEEGEDEPVPGSRISRPHDICPDTLRDPTACEDDMPTLDEWREEDAADRGAEDWQERDMNYEDINDEVV